MVMLGKAFGHNCSGVTLNQALAYLYVFTISISHVERDVKT